MTLAAVTETLRECLSRTPDDGVERINECYRQSANGNDFIWEFWEGVIAVAASLGAESSEMDALVQLIEKLVATHVDDIEEQAIWESKRGLSLSLRENLDSGIWDTLPFGVLAMRETLETDAGMHSHELDKRLKVLQAWVVHAGEHLHRNSGGEENRLMLPGHLWDGPGGMSKDRWDFWKKQLGKLDASENVARSIISSMDGVEKK
ncbi:hypothetical protein MCUN1_001688 [Malassezia cuniculi]|uniref:Uncharacterized protein n=1 Tax=Malassezia cuniculi TaxID=948313 RepID=A0AAF0J6R4_9BASI|nr:hypothetical protein MCUN1_001688 [Malassezia cuniculi]